MIKIKQLSFKIELLLLYVTTALLILFFVLSILIVKFSVYNHVNTDIDSEADKHLSEEIVGNSFHLIHKEEWKEREHNTLDVNPVLFSLLIKKEN
jgi:hypothetical protein